MPSRLVIALVAALLATCGSGCGRARPRVAADNVVLFVVDTLRADRLGCYGYERETSPVVDALAANGLRYTSAYATSPWTFPSAASIVTSLYPEAHGAFLAGSWRNNYVTPTPPPLDPAFETLPEVLQAAGVETSLIAANSYFEFGVEQGFGKVSVKVEDAEARTGAALEWLEALPRDRRFFLLLHFIDPHEPNRPPERLRRLVGSSTSFDNARLELYSRWRPYWARPVGWGHESFPEYRAARTDLYDASVRRVDEQVARVIEAIDSARPGQRTAYLFTADHGEEFWDHAEIEKRIYGSPNTMWGVGHGHTLFQELMHIPLVVYWPEQLAPRVVDTPVSQVDLLPTILDLMDVPDAEVPRQGTSLFESGDGQGTAERPVYFSQPCFGRNKTGVLRDGLKLIRSAREPTLLFDISADPEERHDLSDELPDLRRSLERLLAEGLQRSRDVGHGLRSEQQPAPADVTPEQLERLRALGYAR